MKICHIVLAGMIVCSSSYRAFAGGEAAAAIVGGAVALVVMGAMGGNYCGDENSEMSKREWRNDRLKEVEALKSDLWTPVKFGLGHVDKYEESLSLPYTLFNVGGASAEVIKAGACRSYGAQVGGLGALTRDAYGIQVGGIMAVASEAYGIQLAGVETIAREMYGMQLGFITRNDDMRGIQLGGGLNNDYMCGFQLGLVSNNKKGAGLSICLLGTQIEDSMGAQIGILSNRSTSADGFQLAGIINNDAKFAGIQAALINKAIHCDGIQIGLFNYSESGNRMQIGLLNLGPGNSAYSHLRIPIVHIALD